MSRTILLVLLLALVWTTPAAHGKPARPDAQRSPGRGNLMISRVSLPGEGRGDYLYVDSARGRLFVTHGKTVHLLNLSTLQTVAHVEGLDAAHGVAVDRSGQAFVTDGNSDSVTEFEPSTGHKLKKIAVGHRPDSILFDPASSALWVFNAGSEDISIINPATGKVIKSINLPHVPEYSQTDGRGHIYVNLEDANSVAVLDAHKMALHHLIALAGCDGPAPLAIDPTNRRLFIGCGNQVMVVADPGSGKVVARVPIGEGPDGIAFDPGTKRVFVANRDGRWTIVSQVSADNYRVERTLKIDEYAKTLALDPTTHRVFSSTADLVWPPAVPGKKHLPNAKPGTFRLVVVSQL